MYINPGYPFVWSHKFLTQNISAQAFVWGLAQIPDRRSPAPGGAPGGSGSLLRPACFLQAPPGSSSRPLQAPPPGPSRLLLQAPPPGPSRLLLLQAPPPGSSSRPLQAPPRPASSRPLQAPPGHKVRAMRGYQKLEFCIARPEKKIEVL